MRMSTPILLFDAGYRGTLAVVRTLGQNGVPITVADPNPIAPARWSRHATRWLRSPSTADSDRFIEWLMRFGDEEPHHVLYPTSDEVTFLVAAHRDRLAERFSLYQPGFDVILEVLDK